MKSLVSMAVALLLCAGCGRPQAPAPDVSLLGPPKLEAPPSPPPTAVTSPPAATAAPATPEPPRMCAACSGTKICPVCHGHEKCATCRGAGITEHRKCVQCVCPDCRGQRICTQCRGAKILTCPTCRGALFGADVTRREICNVCGGTGKVSKPVYTTYGGGPGQRLKQSASGSVSVTCRACSGKGGEDKRDRTYCQTCNGQGRIRCAGCNAAGACVRCRGTGYLAGCAACSDRRFVDTPCPACKGAGKCDACGGSGNCALCRRA